MKKVREYLNEKFQEDSDPIKDMNIGIMNIINKFKKELTEKFHHVNDFDFIYILEERIIKIQCDVYTSIGFNALKLTVIEVIEKYKNIFKIKYMPTYDDYSEKPSRKYIEIKVF